MHEALALSLLFAIGVVSGLRVGVPVLWIEWAAYRGLLRANGPVSDLFLDSASVSSVIRVIAVELFEIGLEKSGKAPGRMTLLSLLVRSLAAGTTAAILVEAAGLSNWLGAGLGIVGAITGAYASDRIGKFLVTDAKVPRLLASFVEDGVAIVLGLLVISYFVY
jgi:uncharacterized membrane protein